MSTQFPLKEISIRYGYGLLALFILFCFRVGAQSLQRWAPVNFLPPFEDWQSGALPYELLLAFQIGIIVFCGLIISKFAKNNVCPNRKSGIIYLLIGAVYFSVMLFRLTAGLTFAGDHVWLGAIIPTLFHLVLAAFVLLTGHFHYKFGKK